MIGYLQRVATSPLGQEIKRRAAALLELAPGHAVLDVGCGPATDTVALAGLVGPTGRVIGIDADAAMVQVANTAAARHGVSRWTTHQLGAAAPLAFPAASFDAWHGERVLQHLPGNGPLWALSEAARVLRPGGRAVVVDTDWGTLSICSGNVDLERRIARFHAARFGNAYVGRMLPRLVRQAGLVRTHVECVAAPLAPETLDFVLVPSEQAMLVRHGLTPLEWQTWRRELADLRASGDAFASVTITIVQGRRR